ncbi:nucleotide exchange factor GrpE [Eubacteriales bacterium OttesenSCG-928-N13]|nr:nucleotide exchange factor GrpE [Eubacteriales bacterium OttesenSCG-928-N13]
MTDKQRAELHEDEAQLQPETQENGVMDDDMEEPSQQEWREALEQTVKQRDEYLNMAQRGQAEFANYRKRNEAARAEAFDDGIREALTGMLPFIDNLDRAIEAAQESGEQGALLEGIEMTRKQMQEATAKLGLEEVPALGEVFDPELHNAVMRSSEGEPGTILEVFQKGYSAKGKIIRYPMVRVAAE